MSEQGRFGELLDKYECACREEGYASAFDKNCGDHYEARAAVVAHVAGLEAENARLREALGSVLALYPHHWDRVDGAAVIMPERIQQFEDAFERAAVALEQPK